MLTGLKWLRDVFCYHGDESPALIEINAVRKALNEIK
jgi:hypothetical protein